MSLHLLRRQEQTCIAPSCVSRRHFRENNKVPLNRRELIKKIAEDKLGRTITKSSCFLIPPESFSLKKLSVSRSPLTGRSNRVSLKFGEFKASDVKSINTLDAIRKSLAKNNLRGRYEEKSKQETNRDINTIKSMIDRIVVNNRNRGRREEFKGGSLEANNPETKDVTIGTLKETQQYYNMKRYYEEKYPSC